MDTRRPLERTYRSMLQRMFGGKTWSLNKMKEVKDRLAFLDQVEEMMEDLRGQFGELELSTFTNMLFGVADEHSQRYFRKTVKCVVDDECQVGGSFDECFYISDVLKLLRARVGPPLVEISNFDELKLFLLFGKIPERTAYEWVDEMLQGIVEGPAINSSQQLNDLVGRICEYAVVLNYLRGDLKMALENSGCLQEVNYSAFFYRLQTQEKKAFFTVTPADIEVLLCAGTPETPQETAPSTPISEPYNSLKMCSSFYDLYTTQDHSTNDYFSDITDDEFVVNHSPSFMREPKVAFPEAGRKKNPLNFNMFEDKTFQAPAMGTFRSERTAPYRVGERVYVDASYLYSLDNGRPLVAESLFVGPFEVSGSVSDGVYIVEIPPCFNCSSLLPAEALSATLFYPGSDTERLLLREITNTLEVDPRGNTALIQYADGTKSTVRLDALRRAQTVLEA